MTVTSGTCSICGQSGNNIIRPVGFEGRLVAYHLCAVCDANPSLFRCLQCRKWCALAYPTVNSYRCYGCHFILPNSMPSVLSCHFRGSAGLSVGVYVTLSDSGKVPEDLEDQQDESKMGGVHLGVYTPADAVAEMKQYILKILVNHKDEWGSTAIINLFKVPDHKYFYTSPNPPDCKDNQVQEHGGDLYHLSGENLLNCDAIELPA